MLSKKILSTILAVAVAGGVGTAGAITLANTPKTSAVVASSEISNVADSVSSAVNSAVSSTVSSQVTSSKEVKTVSDSVSIIQKATDDGVSKINSAAIQAVSQVKQAASSNTSSYIKNDPRYIPKYAVIDPNNGDLIFPEDKNYESVKAQLGGDAGTVDPYKSTACKAALAKLKASSETVNKQVQ